MMQEEQYRYEETLMYGKFTTSQLEDYARQEAANIRSLEAQRQEEEQEREESSFRNYTGGRCDFFRRFLSQLKPCYERMNNDWVFLLNLGLIMALISFGLDFSIDKIQLAHVNVYNYFKNNGLVQYIVWVVFPLILITFSVGFTRLVSPHAVGSGIPEMKTILRGTVLKRYLSTATLISKIVGLIAALGSGIPIGKEGPFVHIASMVATVMGKFITYFKGIYQNESRKTEMLAAACAVGVSSTFAAPIGGVLFSIEVTSTYFAVRNYWRGFFAAVCGAFVFRLLSVWDNEEETITALFKTNFRIDFPFDVQEFIAFAIIGIVCGFGGAFFVFTNRKIVEMRRTHRNLKAWKIMEKSQFIYPALVTFVISTITFPKGLGQFMAGELTQKQALNELFSNTTWSLGFSENADVTTLKHWETAHSNIYITLVVFIVSKFIMSAVAVALPVPAGVFFPVFVIGAAFGRLVGETMATWFPEGVHAGNVISPIMPGGYAVVGAAAMSGAVTHTISTAVMVFELTGQITHILPVMIAVLIANAIAQSLQPSFYDSIIQIKRLPYLPDITKLQAYNLFVADFMKKNVHYITMQSTYAELKETLNNSKHKAYPLVDSPETMVLLGSVQRPTLESLLNRQIKKCHISSNVESELDSRPASPRPSSPVSVISYSDGVESPTSMTAAILDPSEVQINDSSRPSISPKSSRGTLLERLPVPQRLQNLFTGSAPTSEEDLTAVDNPDNDVVSQEQAQWERELMQQHIDFSRSRIDPAPFQLVERTSLHKVHKLFALLNLSHAYVTTLGRLMGVVTLKEVRIAIEGQSYFDRSSSEQELVDDVSPPENAMLQLTDAIALEGRPRQDTGF